MYHYAGNNPVKYTDPDGNEVVILGYTDEDKTVLVNMINKYSYSKYKISDDGKTLVKDRNKTNGFFGINKSKYYSERLDEAIKSENKISILLSDTHLRPDGSSIPDISEEHGGGMTSVINNDNSKISVTVSPLGNDKLPLVNKAGKITTKKESPAEILIHELVGHAIPRATGWHGNAVDNENIVRAQCNLKLRRSERNHPCF